MKLNINCYSRKLGAILVIIFLQSSLGTNAALKDFSNVSTKNFSQNGYYRLPDGLMIQWGYVSNTNGMGTVYFPVSFSSIPYSLSFAIQHNTNSTDYNTITVNWTSLTTTSFSYKKGFSQNDTGGSSIRPYYWLVIGRWK